MSNLQNHSKHKHSGFLHGLGQKVQNLAELAGTVKGIYDTGKTVFSLARAASPYVLPLLGVI